MAVIVGSFGTQSQAEQALLRLRGAGIDEDEAVLIANASTASGTVDPADSPDPAGARAAAAAAEPTAVGADEAVDEETEGRATRSELESPARTNTTEKEAEGAVNSAALGAAVGLFVGGGVLGPLGLALGAVAGTGVGIAAALASRGLAATEAERYESDIMEGRYLVAVETERPVEEVRTLLMDSGVDQVKVEA